MFHSDSSAHVTTIRAPFERLRKHNLKLSPSKARLGATHTDFLGHSISSTGVRPNAGKVSALTLLPMSRDMKQSRFLLDGFSYHRKFLRDMSRRIRPITALLKNGVDCLFAPTMEAIVHDTLAELAAPPVLGLRRAVSVCSRRPWKPSCVTCSQSSPLHRSWASPI